MNEIVVGLTLYFVTWGLCLSTALVVTGFLVKLVWRTATRFWTALQNWRKR